MSAFLRVLHRLFWAGLVAIPLVVTAVVLYTEIAVPQVEIRVVFSSPADGQSQLFHSPDGEWTSQRGITLPTIVGINQLDFPLPSDSGNTARWDPGTVAGTYAIASVTLIRDGEDVPLPLDVLATPPHRAELQRLIPEDDMVVLDVVDGDAQLNVSLPALATTSGIDWVVVASLGFVVVVLAGAAVVAWRRRLLTAERIAIGFVFWLFALFLFYVAKLAPRVPYWDDWRYLLDLESDGSLPLSVRWLMTPYNDTVYATGKFFDSVILNATGFSFVTLHLFGVALVGVWLAMMVALIRRVGREVAPWAVPYAIVLLAFALVAQSYWLQPGIAYHQFLPLLFGTGILLVLGGESRPVGRAIAVALLGGLAGFAYISGAVLLALMAAVYAATYGPDLWRQRRIRPAMPGLALGATALATATVQLGLVGVVQGSLLESSSVAETSFPWDPEFWAFFLGTAGRTVGMVGSEVLVALAIAVVFIATPVVLAFAYWRPSPGTKRLGRHAAFVLGSAALVVPVYFAMVAAGRSMTLDPTEPLGAVFRFGAARFHFWWGAALIPLLWLAWLAAARALSRRQAGTRVALIVLITLLIAVPKSISGWNYPEAFGARTLAFQRNASCISSNVRNGNTDFTCAFSSSGNIGPRVLLGYRYDMTFIEDADLPPLDGMADG